MNRSWRLAILSAILMASAAAINVTGQNIPKAAWKRPLGLPLENPGRHKPSLGDGHIDDGYYQGAPVGGFGAGTFSRSYRGDFVRWHLKTGVNKYQSVPTNQFIVRQKAEGGSALTQALCTADSSVKDGFNGWPRDYPVGAGDYYALYPKAWFDYRLDKFPAHLTLEQFSPILPNNYRETSYPLALYYWHASNPSNQKVTVSIMFSWTNMIGWFRDFSPNFSQANNVGNFNQFHDEAINIDGRQVPMKGIVFDRLRQGPVTEAWDGQFAIAGAEVPGVQISYLTTVDLGRVNQDLWRPFSESGRLPSAGENWASSSEPICGAIALTFTLEPGENKLVPMVLSWDMPVVEFRQGRKWLRQYTHFTGSAGNNAWTIAKWGLQQGQDWSAQIDRWQGQYINDGSKPLWYRGMLFNELYSLADNGTLWGKPVGAAEDATAFTYLECFDYSYYDSLDVRFYGSMPLLKFWPDIEKQEMVEFAKTVPEQFPDRHLWAWKTYADNKPAFEQRKVRGALPHDLGSPSEDPVFQINQYNWQETSHWKDMNTKFVLMLYRDLISSGSPDMEFLRKCWPAAKEALDYMRQFDTKGDGLPVNEGYPDQTYDVWPMNGESSYCGGLYLAALRAGEEMAKLMKQPEIANQYHALFEKGRASFIRNLWNGEYFRYDTGSDYRESVMADQLCGQWYANLTGLGELVPRDMVRSALRKVYELNVAKFHNGDLGAVNGIAPDGKILTSNEQVEEVWSGTTLGLASLMLSEGLNDEAFKTAWGIYHVVYERYGYWFRTPEAWDGTGNFRASMYMRPGAVWAMEMIPRVGPVSQVKQ